MNNCNERDVLISLGNSSHCFNPEEVKEWFKVSYADQKEFVIFTQNRKIVFEKWKKDIPHFLIPQLNGMVDFSFKDAIKHENKKFEFKASKDNRVYYLSESEHSLPYRFFSFTIIQGDEIKEVIPSNPILAKCVDKQDFLKNDLVFNKDIIIFFVTSVNRKALDAIEKLFNDEFKNTDRAIPIQKLNLNVKFINGVTQIVKKYFKDYPERVSTIIKNIKFFMEDKSTQQSGVTFGKFLDMKHIVSLSSNGLQTVNTESYMCATKSNIKELMKSNYSYAVRKGSFRLNRYKNLRQNPEIQNMILHPEQQDPNNPLFAEYQALENQYQVLLNNLDNADHCLYKVIYHYWIDGFAKLIDDFNVINLIEMPLPTLLINKHDVSVITTYYKALPSSFMVISDTYEESNENGIQVFLETKEREQKEEEKFVMVEDEKERKENERTFILINPLTYARANMSDIGPGTVFQINVKNYNGVEKQDEFIKTIFGIGMKTKINNTLIYENDNSVIHFESFGQEYNQDTFNPAIYLYKFNPNNTFEFNLYKIANFYEDVRDIDEKENYYKYRNKLASTDFMIDFLQSVSDERAEKDIFIRHYLKQSTGIKLKDTPSKIIVIEDYKNKINLARGIYIYTTDEKEVNGYLSNGNIEEKAETDGYDDDKMILYRNMDFKTDDGVTSIPFKIGNHCLLPGLTLIICDDLIQGRIILNKNKIIPLFIFYEIEDVQDGINDGDVENEDADVDIEEDENESNEGNEGDESNEGDEGDESGNEYEGDEGDGNDDQLMSDL